MTLISAPTPAWEEDPAVDVESHHSIFLDYTKYSTVQGLVYIFLSYQSTFGKVFWSIVLILMSFLGIYWCTQAYKNWIDSPVLTSIKTTTFPVEEVSLSCSI
jgi:hypothetical protein